MELRNEQGLTLEEFLKQYDVTRYPRPSVAVDMAVFTLLDGELSMLLIERRNHPCLGEWALPGGFLEIDEEVECAVLRELDEETGIKDLSFRPVGVFANVGRDARTRTVSLTHMAIAPEGSLKPNAGDDARDAKLFTVHTERSSDGKFRVLLRSCDGRSLELSYVADIAYDAFSGYSVKAEKGDLAFDHSLLLTHALLTLAGIDRDTVLLKLSPSAPERAARAFDDLLHSISR